MRQVNQFDSCDRSLDANWSRLFDDCHSRDEGNTRSRSGSGTTAKLAVLVVRVRRLRHVHAVVTQHEMTARAWHESHGNGSAQQHCQQRDAGNHKTIGVLRDVQGARI